MTVSPPLYERVMGPAFAHLCPAVKALHDVRGDLRAIGRCDVTRGGNWLANRLADLVGMPPAGQDLPLTFSIAQEGAQERWTRDFAGHRFQSVLWNRGEALYERLGPVLLEFRLEVRDGSLSMLMQHGWLFGIVPLPRICLPSVLTREFCADGLYHFDVQVDWPLLGPVIRYRGTLDGHGAK
jgi:hypothetical protein